MVGKNEIVGHQDIAAAQESVISVTSHSLIVPKESSTQISRRNLLLGAAALSALGACTSLRIPTAVGVPTFAELDGLPYHPLPYHMDLCILSYQLYAQSLVWPIDPYYEKHESGEARQAIMSRVRAWAGSGDARNLNTAPAQFGYRGPGRLQGFDDNPLHDPILFRYDTLRPWLPSASVPDETWTILETPGAITGRIAEVHFCARPTGGEEEAVHIQHVANAGGLAQNGARDLLIAFEGGTGDKGEPGQPASLSMMGFVLMRHINGTNDYDVHIAFRGSRSGSLTRAARLAFSDDEARGNPDWITDLGYDFVAAPDISHVGEVHRGFAQSMRSMLPKLRSVFSFISGRAAGQPPRRIFVTGHSLGGGLAQHFVSAMLLGDGFGPSMPEGLGAWPWDALKLVSFAAPVSGDRLWAETLTTEKLQERFFAESAFGITRTDPGALPVNDPALVARLTDSHRPAGLRVLHAADPITTLYVLGGKHVGQTVYVASPNRLGFADPDAHEPSDIREWMLSALSDPLLPPTGWSYQAMAAFFPGIDSSDRGRPEFFESLFESYASYFADYATPTDMERLRSDNALLQQLLSQSTAA